MERICEQDFADEKSKMIFRNRYTYYKTGDKEAIIKMIVQEYSDFSKRIGHIISELRSRLRKEERFAIYGAGKHARLTVDFLKKSGLEDRLLFHIVSDGRKGGVNVRDINHLLNSIMILVPEGQYAAEMLENLYSFGWDDDHITSIPMSVLFDNELERRNDLEDILGNKRNHYIVYGSDWNSILFRDLISVTGRHFDFSIADMQGEDLSYVAAMENVYFVVFSGLRKDSAIRAGVPKSRILHLCNLDELQYFDEEIVPKHKRGIKEVFVDGGSMNLYTSNQFMRWCGCECDRVVAFESDKRCVKICEDALTRLPRLSAVTDIVPKGLWSADTELEFNEVDNYGSSSFVIQKGNGKTQKIPVTSIDQTLKGGFASFIKLDIEGAELEALKGARDTIVKYHPTLAISAYHKPEDILELPEYIKSLVPQYKMYLRNYHMDLTETVLYAICE